MRKRKPVTSDELLLSVNIGWQRRSVSRPCGSAILWRANVPLLPILSCDSAGFSDSQTATGYEPRQPTT